MILIYETKYALEKLIDDVLKKDTVCIQKLST